MFDKELVGRLYQEAGMLKPANLDILNHIMGVAHVAGFLGWELNRRNAGIDLKLMVTAAMIHDIGKLFDESPRGHTLEGTSFLRKQGVDRKIVHIVLKHQVWNFEIGAIPEPKTWEERLVFLADMAFQDRIMPVKERVEYLIKRYRESMPPGREEWLRKTSQAIYQEILTIISPETLPF